MIPSRVKRKWRSGQAACGTIVHSIDPSICEMVGLTGIDCVWLDLEHHQKSEQTTADLIRALRVAGSDCVARPARGEFARAARLFEIGAKGIIYFAHQFKPRFIEAGLLADEAMAREIKAINAQILELAPVLNSPDIADGATVTSSDPNSPVDFVVKKHAEATYVLSVNMREGDTTATFTLPGAGKARIEVLGESRTIDATGGTWQDRFTRCQVHLYRVAPSQ